MLQLQAPVKYFQPGLRLHRVYTQRLFQHGLACFICTHAPIFPQGPVDGHRIALSLFCVYQLVAIKRKLVHKTIG